MSAAGATLAGILLLALLPGGSQEATPGEPDDGLAGFRLAFTSGRSGNDEIWVVGADGAGLERLTDSGRSRQGDHAPRGSPDGRTIAFNSYRFGGWKVALMAADGSEIRRLTRNARSVYEGSPAWSPDGSRIAFMRYRSQQGIWVVGADGSEAEWILDNGRDYYINAQPSWTPDGEHILYVSREGGDYEICSMRADGTERTSLTENDSDDLAPAMSPDGERILFYSNRDGHFETYVMGADGSEVLRLTHRNAGPAELEEGPGGSDALDPAWSPDGRWIAVVEVHDGQRDIFLMRPDGSDRRRLTDDPADDYGPDWTRR